MLSVFPLFVSAVGAHERHPVPARLTLWPDRYELDVVFDIPALMLSRTLNHSDPAELARDLLALSPDDREAVHDQARRFVRINLRLDIDGKRESPVLELPTFEDGPLGRLGDPGVEFQFRLSGAVPPDATSIRVHPGRALGVVDLVILDGSGATIHRESLLGGIGSGAISLVGPTGGGETPTRVPTLEPSQAAQGPDSGDDAFIPVLLKGLKALRQHAMDVLLLMLAMILLGPALRTFGAQLASYVAGAFLSAYLSAGGYIEVPAVFAGSLSAGLIVLIGLENLRVDRLLPARPAEVFVGGLVQGLMLGGGFLIVESGRESAASAPPLALSGYLGGIALGLIGSGFLGWLLGRLVGSVIPGKKDGWGRLRRLGSAGLIAVGSIAGVLRLLVP